MKLVISMAALALLRNSRPLSDDPHQMNISRADGIYVLNEASDEQSTNTAYAAGLTSSPAYKKNVEGHAIFVPIAKILPSVNRSGSSNGTGPTWIPWFILLPHMARSSPSNLKQDFRVQPHIRNRCRLDLLQRVAPTALRSSTFGSQEAVEEDAAVPMSCCRGCPRYSSSGLRPLLRWRPSA